LSENGVRKVQVIIDREGLDAQVIWHRDKPVLSMEDAIAVHGIPPKNVLKCLIMKDRKGRVIAVMAPGDIRIDVKKLEHLTDYRKLTFLAGEELTAKLSVEPGAVDPLTLPERVREVFVERSLMDKEFVIGSAGSKYCGLKIKPAEIIKVVEATILDLQ
jgi:prolyl-tRNA editing enzyme YbaK/EbsC (Cys-tRNA(Pro) deacylase)